MGMDFADFYAQVDTAMEATQGNRLHVAIMLGVEAQKIHDAIRNDPGLRAKWGKEALPEVPTGAEGNLDPGIGLPANAEAIAEKLSRQDALVKKGLEKLSFSDEKKSFILALQTSYGKHWADLGQMFQGGIVYTTTELLCRFNALVREIEKIDANPDAYVREMHGKGGSMVVKDAHEFRLEMLDRMMSLAELLRKLNSDRERAALIAAQIQKLKEKEVESQKPTRKRARWIKPEVTVEANEQEN